MSDKQYLRLVRTAPGERVSLIYGRSPDDMDWQELRATVDFLAAQLPQVRANTAAAIRTIAQDIGGR